MHVHHCLGTVREVWLTCNRLKSSTKLKRIAFFVIFYANLPQVSLSMRSGVGGNSALKVIMDAASAKPRINGSMLSKFMGQYVCLVGKNLGVSGVRY